MTSRWLVIIDIDLKNIYNFDLFDPFLTAWFTALTRVVSTVVKLGLCPAKIVRAETSAELKVTQKL